MTPRSWVIITIAAPVACWAVLSTSRICAWMVTSRAVVGSSAMITAVEAHRAADPRGARQQPHHRERRDRLPRAGLADDAEHLARGHRVAHPPHRAHRPGLAGEGDGQLGDREDLAHSRPRGDAALG